MPRYPARRPTLAPLVALACALGVPPAAARAQAQPAAQPPAPPAGRDSAAAAVALDSARAALTRALNSGSKTTLLAAFADSARVTHPGAPQPTAAGEFADFWLQQGTAVSSLRPASLRVTGPADATETGEYTLASGNVGRYTITWRRSPAGRWAVTSLTSG